MSKREIASVLSHIQGLRVTGLDGAHITERMDKWNVSATDIRQAVKYGDLIECHANNLPDIRFVMRNDSGLRSICVCASHTGEVITVWVNTVNDHHSTLNTGEYQWTADMSNVFNALGGNRATS